MTNFILSTRYFSYFNFIKNNTSIFNKITITFLSNEKGNNKRKELNSFFTTIYSKDCALIIPEFNNYTIHIKNGIVQDTNNENTFIILWEDITNDN